MGVAGHPEATVEAVRSAASQVVAYLEASPVVVMAVAEATDKKQDQLTKKRII